MKGERRVHRTLPFGSQFSPKQIDLYRVLQIAKRHQGDPDSLNEEVRATFFSDHAGGDRAQQLGLAKNVRLALRDYGLVDNDNKLTDTGLDLLNKSGDEISATFARHILPNLRGLEFINTIRDMKAADERVSLPLLHKRLGERGLYFSCTGTHASSLNSWLVAAGVTEPSRDYVLNEQRLAQPIGIDLETIDKLEELTTEQQAFLKALANIRPLRYIDFMPASELADYAQTLYGVEFAEKAMVVQVLAPLEKAGFIETRRTTAGRGAKPTAIRPTQHFIKEKVTPVIGALARSAGPAIRRVARSSLSQILGELRSTDRHVKALSLEALGVYLFRLPDLDFVKWRLRRRATGGVEVDVIVEGARLVFSRWQIQCKNTERVSLDDVAKEVGLAFHLESNVVAVVSTRALARDATEYAREIMQSTNLNIVLLQRRHLAELTERPTQIVDFLNEQARQTMELKRLPDDA